MPDIDTAAWYALGVPLYLVYLALEIILSRRRPERVWSFAETLSNLTAGLGTLILGLFAGPLVFRAWNLAYQHLAPVHWPTHGAWKIPAAVVLADFCYYLYHRAGHRFAILWSIHGIHHQHECVNSSVGFRLEWLADPYAALFFGLMPLAGVDSQTGFAAIALLSFYTLTAHSPVLPRPSLGFIVTPAIHGSHHSRDGRFAGKNYGAMLGIWDRLFGTWQEPKKGEALRLEVPSISRTHNGVAAQWSLIAELAQGVRSERTIGGKLRRLLGRPELIPPGAQLRDDAELPWALRIYVLIQFATLALFSEWLLWLREGRPLAVQLVSAAAAIGGLYTLGGLLDGSEDALRQERLRLLGTVPVGLGLGLYDPWVGAAVAGGALAGLLGLSGLSAAVKNAPRASCA